MVPTCLTIGRTMTLQDASLTDGVHSYKLRLASLVISPIASPMFKDCREATLITVHLITSRWSLIKKYQRPKFPWGNARYDVCCS